MKRFLRYIPALAICLFSPGKTLLGQINPPGLSTANTSGWLAFGIRQPLDKANTMQSFTYTGMSFVSDPESYNPLQKPGIFILNEEFYHQFHKHWQYSLALSYRRQSEYEDLAPYDRSDPRTRQEFRVYGRYSFIQNWTRVRMVLTYRQELRKFFTPGFDPWNEDTQIRTRFRVQMALSLDEEKVHRLVMSAEPLFSTSHRGTPKAWDPFRYRESRICFYYSLKRTESPLTFNLGYMNNPWGTGAAFHMVHYLGFDIIWENPLKSLRRESDKAVGPLE